MFERRKKMKNDHRDLSADPKNELTETDKVEEEEQNRNQHPDKVDIIYADQQLKRAYCQLKKRYQLPLTLLAHDVPALLLSKDLVSGNTITGLAATPRDVERLVHLQHDKGLAELHIRFADHISIQAVGIAVQFIENLSGGGVRVVNPQLVREKTKCHSLLKVHDAMVVEAIQKLESSGDLYRMRHEFNEARKFFGRRVGILQNLIVEALERLLLCELFFDNAEGALGEAIWILQHHFHDEFDLAITTDDGNISESGLQIIRQQLKERLRDKVPVDDNLYKARRYVLGIHGRYHLEWRIFQILKDSHAALVKYTNDPSSKDLVIQTMNTQKRALQNLIRKRSLIGCEDAGLPGDPITEEHHLDSHAEEDKEDGYTEKEQGFNSCTPCTKELDTSGESCSSSEDSTVAVSIESDLSLSSFISTNSEIEEELQALVAAPNQLGDSSIQHDIFATPFLLSSPTTGAMDTSPTATSLDPDHTELCCLDLLKKRYRLPETLILHASPVQHQHNMENLDDGVTGVVTSIEDARRLNVHCQEHGLANIRIHYADYISLASFVAANEIISSNRGGPCNAPLILNPKVAKEKMRTYQVLKAHDAELKHVVKELEASTCWKKKEVVLMHLRAKLASDSTLIECRLEKLQKMKEEALDRLLFLDLSSQASDKDLGEAIWILKHYRPDDFKRAVSIGDGHITRGGIAAIRKQLQGRLKGKQLVNETIFKARSLILGIFGRIHLESKLLLVFNNTRAALKNYMSGLVNRMLSEALAVLAIKKEQKVLTALGQKWSLIGCYPICLPGDEEYDDTGSADGASEEDGFSKNYDVREDSDIEPLDEDADVDERDGSIDYVSVEASVTSSFSSSDAEIADPADVLESDSDNEAPIKFRPDPLNDPVEEANRYQRYLMALECCI